MGIAQWLGVILTFANVCCALIYMYAPRRHRHDYSAWSQWTISQSATTAEGLRYRHCRQCQKVERQESGWHHCDRADIRKPCTHLGHLNESEIARLEKELGL